MNRTLSLASSPDTKGATPATASPRTPAGRCSACAKRDEAEEETAPPRNFARVPVLQRKGMDGVASAPEIAPPIAALGQGRPLESSARTRMESAFGSSFHDVMVHTDGHAASLSNTHDARAVTVGSHIAFASGEYRPGNPVGDALLAHELAHVVQQRGHSEQGPALGGGMEFETDADLAAVHAVAALWGGGAKKAAPRLQSGLRLSSCGRRKTVIPESASPFGKFEIEDGLVSQPSAPGEGGSYGIRIEMFPNFRTANAAQIGFIQTLRRGTTPGTYSTLATDPGMSAERARRTVQDPTQAWILDRYNAEEARTPFYGQELTASGDHTGSDHARIGSFGGENPVLEDTPGFGFPRETKEFIACAVCETPVAGAPNERGRSYGCINWGFVFDNDREPKFVAETPTFSIQNGWTDFNDRSRATNRAVDRWNDMRSTYNSTAAAGSEIEEAPRVHGLPPARIRGEGPVELRQEQGGRLILAGNLLYGRVGLTSALSVLRRSVRRLDHDDQLKFMTEVLYGSTIGWVPEADLEFPETFGAL